jgi:hypothetical protein
MFTVEVSQAVQQIRKQIKNYIGIAAHELYVYPLELHFDSGSIVRGYCTCTVKNTDSIVRPAHESHVILMAARERRLQSWLNSDVGEVSC